MIIWINGAFGVGKSHTAYELARRVDNSFIFDPEKVGFFLRKNLPNANQYDDFQQNPLWRSQVLENLKYCDKQGITTIVPMTIVNDEIFDFLIEGLRKNNSNVQHFALIANKETVEKRLIRRGDKNAWNFKQVDRCLAALSKSKYDIQVDTEKKNLDEVVEYIARHCGLELRENRLTWLLRKLNWIKVTLSLVR